MARMTSNTNTQIARNEGRSQNWGGMRAHEHQRQHTAAVLHAPHLLDLALDSLCDGCLLRDNGQCAHALTV